MPEHDRTSRGEKRERILESAVHVFAEKGFYLARISDVAENAGIADGTIYLYFKNKDDLLLTIFEEKMDLLMGELDRALDGVENPLDRIRTFARHHFRQVKAHPRLAEVLQVELRLSNKFLKEYRPTKLWSYLGRVGDMVKEGQAQGLIRPEVDPFIAMWMLFGALDEIAMQWVLARKKDRFSLEKAADDVADCFIRGISTLNTPGGTT